MSEKKVLGFEINPELKDEDCWPVFKSELVPVVTIKWLEEEATRQHERIKKDSTIKHKLDRHWAIEHFIDAIKEKAGVQRK